jgi:hypothetical protein
MRLLMRLASGLLGLCVVLTMPALANDISNSTWSETDGSNNHASPNGWTSGVMLPSQVEPTARAMMGAVKRFYNHINGAMTTGGTANAQTLTYGVAPAAYVSGDVYRFLVGGGLTNTGAATLNINSLGAISIKNGGVALAGGELTAGRYVSVIYDGTNFEVLSVGPSANAIRFGNVNWMESISSFSESASQVTSLAANSKQYGLMGAARTSDLTAPYIDSFGIGAFGVCDSTSGSTTGCWPIYGEEWRMAGTTTQFSQGAEFDIINQDTTVAVTPYNMFPTALTAALWVTSGKPAVSNLQTASAAIGIVNNGSDFKNGIVFEANAVHGNDGTNGTATAILMPKGDAIVWQTPAGGTGATIRSDTSTSGQGLGQFFGNNFVLWQNPDGSTAFQINATASSVNNVIAFSNTTGNSPGFTTGSGGIEITSSSGTILLAGSTFNITTLPTSAGGGGIYVCVDSSGNLYKKSACP